MGTKLPSGASSGNSEGDGFSVPKWHHDKEAWRFDRSMQGNQTADVLRVTESGGDASAGIEPTYTAVSGLTGLNVFADQEIKRYERKYGGLIEEANILLVFYDVASSITENDRIEFDGRRYRPLQVDFEEESGRIQVLAALERSGV